MEAQQIFEAAERYMHANEWKNAIEKLDQALSRNPTFAWGYYARGYCKYKIYEEEDALPDLTKSITLDQSNSEAFYMRALIYNNFSEVAEEKGNTDLIKQYLIMSIDDCTATIELDSEKGEAYFLRGLNYIKLDQENNLAKAKIDFEFASNLGVEQAKTMLSKI